MIDDLKPYPAYKDSGSAWIGAVPSTWTIHSLRSLTSSRAERNQPELPLLSVARERGVFVRSLTGEDDNHNIIPEDLTNYKVARAGTLVINKMKAWQGSMGIAPCDGVVSPAYYVFELRIANTAFGEALLRSKPYVAHFGQASDGVRIGQWDLNITRMRQIPAAIPPPEEQAAIVRCIEYVDRRIRRYIRAKQKLIQLLEEQKAVVVHRAVTRGPTHHNVYLRSSGVDWLGDIPADWKVQRLKTICSMKSGDNITAMTIENSGAYPVYGGNGIRGYSSNFTHDGAYALVGRQGALCGNVHFVTGRFWASEHAVVTSARNEVNIEWLVNVLTVMNLNQYSIAAAQPGLAVDRILNLFVPVPSTDEQGAIAATVREGCLGLTAAIERSKREIVLLREFHSRLIADVVTGKLDVRRVADSLPDQISQDEWLLDEMEPFAEDGLDDNDSGLEASLEEVEA